MHIHTHGGIEVSESLSSSFGSSHRPALITWCRKVNAVSGFGSRNRLLLCLGIFYGIILRGSCSSFQVSRRRCDSFCLWEVISCLCHVPHSVSQRTSDWCPWCTQVPGAHGILIPTGPLTPGFTCAHGFLIHTGPLCTRLPDAHWSPVPTGFTKLGLCLFEKCGVCVWRIFILTSIM